MPADLLVVKRDHAVFAILSLTNIIRESYEAAMASIRVEMNRLMENYETHSEITYTSLQEELYRCRENIASVCVSRPTYTTL